ncbi:unnamed protein product, partial [Discosporangium mesarthrocarpum]
KLIGKPSAKTFRVRPRSQSNGESLAPPALVPPFPYLSMSNLREFLSDLSVLGPHLTEPPNRHPPPGSPPRGAAAGPGAGSARESLPVAPQTYLHSMEVWTRTPGASAASSSSSSSSSSESNSGSGPHSGLMPRGPPWPTLGVSGAAGQGWGDGWMRHLLTMSDWTEWQPPASAESPALLSAPVPGRRLGSETRRQRQQQHPAVVGVTATEASSPSAQSDHRHGSGLGDAAGQDDGVFLSRRSRTVEAYHLGLLPRVFPWLVEETSLRGLGQGERSRGA